MLGSTERGLSKLLCAWTSAAAKVVIETFWMRPPRTTTFGGFGRISGEVSDGQGEYVAFQRGGATQSGQWADLSAGVETMERTERPDSKAFFGGT